MEIALDTRTSTNVCDDNRRESLRNLILTRGARRLAFLGEDGLIIMKGLREESDIVLFDLPTR